MAVQFENPQSVSVSQANKSALSSYAASPSFPLPVNYPIEVSFADEHQSQLFLRQLKQISQQNRWIMFIGEEALIDKILLQSAEVDLNKVLVLKNKKGLSDPRLMEMALQSGNCSAVIACGDIENFSNQNICEAADSKASLAFVINRQHKQKMTFH